MTEHPVAGGCDKGEKVQQIIVVAREYFSSPGILAAIDAQAKATLCWMRANTESYDTLGNPVRRAPWWPQPSSGHTECPVLLETRRRLLRDRAYEHGILHMLDGLVQRGVIDDLDLKSIDIIINATTPAVLNQMVAHRYTDGPDGVSLAGLRDLFGNGKGTSPTKLRDRIVTRLCPIGILNARYADGYMIELGPVAEAFFARVYTVIVNETDVNPKDKS